MQSAGPFAGYPQPTSNTTYTPNQFFDVVLPHASRGTVRLVAYMLRKVLGWSDSEGRPQEPQVLVSYRQLEAEAGIGHSMIRQAIDEAISRRYIQCVRAGAPNASGAAGSSALYEIRWDERDRYITDPQEFDGFYSGNGNLTYIPNLFFDHTVRYETLSVVKVVGAIIRHTIGFQTRYGFRRQQVAMSFTEIQRRVNIPSPATTNAAIRQAIENNHIVRIEEGRFDRDAGKNSRATVYGIRWHGEPNILEPVTRVESPSAESQDFEGDALAESVLSGDIRRAVEISLQQSISVHSEKHSGSPEGDAPKNIAGRRTEKRSGNTPNFVAAGRSEIHSDVKITPENNTSKQQQQVAATRAVVSAAAVHSPTDSVSSEKERIAVQALVEEGFDSKAAALLVRKSSPDRVLLQIAWSAKRRASQNRLGLLRRAIEEDWPEPQPAVTATMVAVGQAGRDGKDDQEAAFCRAFYAAWTHSDAPGFAPPLPTSGEKAAARGLLDLIARRADGYGSEGGRTDPDKDAAGQGTAFGRFVREQTGQSEHRRMPRSLVIAARELGGEFLQSLKAERRRARVHDVHMARVEHEAAYQEDWLAYVESRQEEVAAEEPEALALFREEEERQRRGVAKFTARLVPGALEEFDTVEQHLRRFAAFFSDNRAIPVMDFWSWDARLNPRRFVPDP